MKKNVNLSKAVRDDVALKLTVKAVEKNAPKIAERLEKINRLFWEKHASNVEKLLKREKQYWPELINAGIITGVTTIEAKVINGDYSECLIRMEVSDIEKLILGSSQFSGVSKFICAQRYYTHSYCMNFKTEQTIPRIKGMDTVKCNAMIKDVKQVEEQIKNVLDAAVDFHRQVMAILMSCKTLKQLENILPEAAALIPVPAETGKALMPVEQAKAVSKMLKTGIPSQKVNNDQPIQL